MNHELSLHNFRLVYELNKKFEMCNTIEIKKNNERHLGHWIETAGFFGVDIFCQHTVMIELLSQSRRRKPIFHLA